MASGKNLNEIEQFSVNGSQHLLISLELNTKEDYRRGSLPSELTVLLGIYDI